MQTPNKEDVKKEFIQAFLLSIEGIDQRLTEMNARISALEAKNNGKTSLVSQIFTPN